MPPWELPPVRLLVVCTANQCRSPMGEAFARDRAAHFGIPLLTASAGTRAVDGVPATDDAQETMRRLGFDLSAHRSRAVSGETTTAADLVVAMERDHVLDLVEVHDVPLPKTFTVLELAAMVRASPRSPGEPVAAYLDRVGAERTTGDVMRAPGLADPVGRSLRRHRRVAEQIRDAFGVVMAALAGTGRIDDDIQPTRSRDAR